MSFAGGVILIIALLFLILTVAIVIFPVLALIDVMRHIVRKMKSKDQIDP